MQALRTDQLGDLQKIVERSTNAFTGLNQGSDSSLLTGLFAAIVDQFVLVADLHVLLSRTLVRSAERNQADPMSKLESGEIWAKVQTVVSIGRCFNVLEIRGLNIQFNSRCNIC